MAMNFPVPIGLNTDELGRGMRLISCPVLSLVGMLMSRLMIPCSSHTDWALAEDPWPDIDASSPLLRTAALRPCAACCQIWMDTLTVLWSIAE